MYRVQGIALGSRVQGLGFRGFGFGGSMLLAVRLGCHKPSLMTGLVSSSGFRVLGTPPTLNPNHPKH